MYIIYLINQKIHEKEKLQCCYYKIAFIKFEKEEDIKLSLINMKVNEDNSPYYFVLRENNKVVLKSKLENFYREKDVGGIENICEYVKMCEENKISSKMLELRNPPDTYIKNNKIRVYNQLEHEKIMTECVEYLDEEDEKKIYFKELDQDRNIYLCVRTNWFTYLKSKNKGPNWGIVVKWSEELISELYENTEFSQELYEKFKIKPREIEEIKTKRRIYVSNFSNKKRHTSNK